MRAPTHTATQPRGWTVWLPPKRGWENEPVRTYNFSAGPSMMPLEVLERAAAELTEWKGGMSVMEVSHRGKDFVETAAATEAKLRSIASIPDNYKVLFLQGGGYGQFSAVPLNLTSPGDVVDVLNTGQWSAKAAKEAARFDLDVRTIVDEKASNYTTTPAPGSFTVDPDAAYVHYTPNETIGGVEFGYVPETGDVPLVADYSSTILSRPLDVAAHGVIFAGTQKNMGPSGMAVVIVRDDLLDRARPQTPSIWSYKAMAAADSMLNTPPTFSIYMLGLVLDWITDNGGLAGMEARNREKAEALYAAIDGSEFYSNPVALDSRSWMNVPFLLADPSLDKTFVAEAAEAGLMNLAGHRSVGGLRASIYNAMPIEGVRALIDFMDSFAARHG